VTPPHVFVKHVTCETSLGAGSDHDPQMAFRVNNQTLCNFFGLFLLVFITKGHFLNYICNSNLGQI